MRMHLLMAFLHITMLLLSACENRQILGSGNIVADYRDVKEFRGIAISLSGTLLIKQGFKSALVIQGDENLLDYVESKVDNGVLRIGRKEVEGSLLPTKDLIFYVTVRDLNQLDVAGSGEVKSIEQILGERLDLKVKGSVHVMLDVEMKTLSLTLIGKGKVFLSGQTHEQRVDITGQGRYDGSALESGETFVKIIGEGRAVISTVDLLDVELVGSGSVTYVGCPKVNESILGEGKVYRLPKYKRN